ncbi:FAD assembly factor SdhE [Chitiniphilus eburneus]|uniref:FAD assembly factor SdhE n=1 Tax=Chitiniphilus eburneus TaxID=2571148 RepID=A0A4U0PIK7_9NEIS|nr:succinate dehydrogenase assembly factor 2 [Chitiniphilus eburneus]TJZ67747.1 succinate dehydrogenase assembly factor 2 family protein [Chitiniphilus eburneus]
MSELDEVELKRIIWRSRRGLLELDLQLERFVSEALPQLNEADLLLYRELLQLPDNDLLDYLNGRSPCPTPRLLPIIERIRAAQR